MPITNIGNAVAIAMITVAIRPKIHAANNNGLRPTRSASLPAGMCVIAIAAPNAPKMNPICCSLLPNDFK